MAAVTGIAIVPAHTRLRAPRVDLRGVDPRMTEQRALFLKIVVLLEQLHRHSTAKIVWLQLIVAERVRKISGCLQPFITVSRLS
jgi:hypothetical protein